MVGHAALLGFHMQGEVVVPGRLGDQRATGIHLLTRYHSRVDGRFDPNDGALHITRIPIPRQCWNICRRTAHILFETGVRGHAVMRSRLWKQIGEQVGNRTPAGEVSNVEIGTTNELFPNERSAVAGCVFNATPEDATNLLNQNPNSPNFNTTVGTASEMSSDVDNFAMFSRLSAPPTPAPPTQSTQNGQRLFESVGCALCHSESLTSGPSPYTGMSGMVYHPYSDFALHHMGSGLADGIVQGAAGPDEFRTAPLWGIGQRLYFLHDGRTSDLLQAILEHASPGNACRNQVKENGQQGNCGSEANRVIRNFQLLGPSQIQDILNFLRSL